MHAMAQLELAANNSKRDSAIASALAYPRPAIVPLMGIDAPRRSLFEACEQIMRARRAAKIAADWTRVPGGVELGAHTATL